MATVDEILASNKQSWNEVAPRFFGRTALPTYGPFAPDELQLNLFGEDCIKVKRGTIAQRGLASSRWYSVEKAELIPTTFIIKCSKPA